jgi:hypothetical protein
LNTPIDGEMVEVLTLHYISQIKKVRKAMGVEKAAAERPRPIAI